MRRDGTSSHLSSTPGLRADRNERCGGLRPERLAACEYSGHWGVRCGKALGEKHRRLVLFTRAGSRECAAEFSVHVGWHSRLSHPAPLWRDIVERLTAAWWTH